METSRGVRNIAFQSDVTAKLWSAAACCRWLGIVIVARASRPCNAIARCNSREQARGEESGRKLPHSKASHAHTDIRRPLHPGRCPSADGR
jgi:hypothetical protein